MTKEKNMNIGVSVTKSEVRLSMRKFSAYTEAVIRGYDATSYSKMPKCELENLKKELLKCIAEFNLSGEPISSAVVSFPLALTFMELLDLKKLFQAMGIEIKRYIDNGMARGLAATLSLAKDFSGYTCCAGHSGDHTELSLLCIDDGVVEAIQSTVFSIDEKLDDATVVDRLDDWMSAYDIQALCYEPSDSRLADCDLVSAKELELKPVFDEYATSRGALLQAEILNGVEGRWLPMEIFPDSILCVVNGEDEVELLEPNITIPAARSVEVSTISPDWTEIELVSINNSTGKETSLFKTIFASLPEKRTVKVSIDINANKSVSIVIDTKGSHIELSY